MTGIDKLIIYSYREHVHAIERATAARDAEIARLRVTLKTLMGRVQDARHDDDVESAIAEDLLAILVKALAGKTEQPQ